MKQYKTEQELLNDNMDRIFKNEDLLQEVCFQWTWNWKPETRRCIWHVPNGGDRRVVQAIQLQAMGVVAGVSDMHFYWQSQLYIIELKVGTNTLSKAQEAYRDTMIQQGAIFYECRSFKEWYNIVASILLQQPRSVADRILAWFENTFGLKIWD